jgi:hypothetical protein
MYEWWLKRFPKPWVDAGYACWYAGLVLLVLLLADRPLADFYYLHG